MISLTFTPTAALSWNPSSPNNLIDPLDPVGDGMNNSSAIALPENKVSLSSDEQYMFLLKWGSYGSGIGQFQHIQGVVVDSMTNVYVADYFGNNIQKFSSSGTFLNRWGNGLFTQPQAIAVDSFDNIYVTDRGNQRVIKFSSSGAFITSWSGFTDPRGLGIDSAGNVYVSDWTNKVQKFSSTGNYITKWGSFGSGDGQFQYPYGIAVDSSDNIYVADTLNNRIQKFSSTGTFIGKWGSFGSADNQFNEPWGIAIDSSDNVYVADRINNRIQKFSSDGTFLTKWGNNGSANGQFHNPFWVATDSSDNVYVSDTFNNRIQKFAPVVPIYPIMTSINPVSGYQNSTVVFIITGAGFQPHFTSVEFRNQSSGIISTKLTNVTSTKIVGKITIPKNSSTGFWNIRIITTSNGENISTNSFIVKKNQIPKFTSINPKSAVRNTTLNFSITGANFQTGLTTVQFRNATGSILNKITLTKVTASRINGTIVIPSRPWLGPYNIIIKTADGGTVRINNGFNVTIKPLPSFTSIVPSTVYRDTTVSYSIIGKNFQPDLTNVIFLKIGSTAIPTKVISITPTSITGKATIPASAAAGLWNVRIKTIDGGITVAPNVINLL